MFGVGVPEAQFAKGDRAVPLPCGIPDQRFVGQFPGYGRRRVDLFEEGGKVGRIVEMAELGGKGACAQIGQRSSVGNGRGAQDCHPAPP